MVYVTKSCGHFMGCLEAWGQVGRGVGQLCCYRPSGQTHDVYMPLG